MQSQGIHIVGGVKEGSATSACGRIDEGDEIVQVNYRTVVGWQITKLIDLMKDYPTELILTIKKRPRLQMARPTHMNKSSLLKNPLQMMSSTVTRTSNHGPSNQSSSNFHSSSNYAQYGSELYQQPNMTSNCASATQLPANVDKSKATIRRRATISGATAVLEALRNAEANGKPNALAVNLPDESELVYGATSLLQSKAVPQPPSIPSPSPVITLPGSIAEVAQNSPAPLQRQPSTVSTFKCGTVSQLPKNVPPPPCPPPRQNSCLSTASIQSIGSHLSVSKHQNQSLKTPPFPATLRKQGTCLALPARPPLGNRQLSLMSNLIGRPPAAQPPRTRPSPTRSPVRIPPLNRAVTATQLLEQNANFLLANPNSPLSIARSDSSSGPCTGLLLSGWLHTRREHFNVSLNAKARWCRKFVLLTSDYMLYTFRNEQSPRADLVLHLPAFKMSPTVNSNDTSTHATADQPHQHAFKAYNKHVIFLFSAESTDDQRRWIDSLRQLLTTCAQHRPELLLAAASPDVVCYSETEDEEDEVNNEHEMQNYANEMVELESTDSTSVVSASESNRTDEIQHDLPDQIKSPKIESNAEVVENDYEPEPHSQEAFQASETTGNEDEDEKHNRRMMRLLNRRRQRYQPIEADRLSPFLAENGELSLSELRARLQHRNLSRQNPALTVSQQAVAAAISQPMNRRSISCLDNQSITGLRDRLQRLHQAADAGLAATGSNGLRRAGSQNSLQVSCTTSNDHASKTDEMNSLNDQLQKHSLNDNSVKSLYPAVPPRPPKPTALQMTPKKAPEVTLSNAAMPSIQPRRSKNTETIVQSDHDLPVTTKQDKNNNQVVNAPCKPSRLSAKDSSFEMRKPQVPQKPEHLQLLGPTDGLTISASASPVQEQSSHETSAQQHHLPETQHTPAFISPQPQQQASFHSPMQQHEPTPAPQPMTAPAPQLMSSIADQYGAPSPSKPVHQPHHQNHHRHQAPSSSMFDQPQVEVTMHSTTNETFIASCHQQSTQQVISYQVEEMYQYAEQQTYSSSSMVMRSFAASHMNAHHDLQAGLHHDEDDEDDDVDEDGDEIVDDEDDLDDENLLDDEEEDEEEEDDEDDDAAHLHGQHHGHHSHHQQQHSMQSSAVSGGGRLFGMLDGGAPGLSAAFGPMRQTSESPALMDERVGRCTQLSSTNSDLTNYSDQVFLPGAANNVGRSDCGMAPMAGPIDAMHGGNRSHGLDEHNHLSSAESSPGPLDETANGFEAQPNAHQIAALNQLAALGQLAESGQLNEAQQAAAVQQYYAALAELQSAEYWRVLQALQQQAIQQQLPPEVQQQIAVQFQQQFQAHFQQQLQIQLQQQLQMQAQAQAEAVAGNGPSNGADMVSGAGASGQPYKPQSLHSLQSSATSPCSESISDEGSCGTGAGLFGSAIGGIGSLGHHGSDESLSSSSGSLMSSSNKSSGSKSTSFRLFGSPKLLKKLTTLKHQKEKRTTTTITINNKGSEIGEAHGNKDDDNDDDDDNHDGDNVWMPDEVPPLLDSTDDATGADVDIDKDSNAPVDARIRVEHETIQGNSTESSIDRDVVDSIAVCHSSTVTHAESDASLSSASSTATIHSINNTVSKSAAVIKSTGSLCTKLFGRASSNTSSVPQITQVIYKRGRSAEHRPRIVPVMDSFDRRPDESNGGCSDDGQVILITPATTAAAEEPIYADINELHLRPVDDQPQRCGVSQSDSNRLMLSTHTTALVQP